MTTKTPAQLARSRLAKRASDHIALANKIVPKHLQKTPSQKRSEAGRKKFLKRAGIKETEEQKVIPSDCRDCKNECRYNHDLNLCQERSLVLRCKQCGQKVRFRVITSIAWELCPVCRSK